MVIVFTRALKETILHLAVDTETGESKQAIIEVPQSKDSTEVAARVHEVAVRVIQKGGLK